LALGRQKYGEPIKIITSFSEYINDLFNPNRHVLTLEPNRTYVVPKQIIDVGKDDNIVEMVTDMFNNYDSYLNNSNKIRNQKLWNMVKDIKENDLPVKSQNTQLNELIDEINNAYVDSRGGGKVIKIVGPEPRYRTQLSEMGIKFVPEGKLWFDKLYFKKGGRFNKRPKLIKKCKRYEN
jgi:hypothetical protein